MPAARLLPMLLGLFLLSAPAAWGQQAGALPPKPLSPAVIATSGKPANTHAPPKAAPVAPVHRAGERPARATPVVKPKATSPKSLPAHGKPGAPSAAAPNPAPALEAKPAEPAEPLKGSATGLALPRFAALRSDDVNMRGGPGTRYPIQWVYKRRDLPVRIEREFEVWRLVEDPEGVKGWVHQATLTGRRSFVVTGAARTVRREPDESSAAVAILKPGVIGRLRACGAGAAWCEVQVGEFRGWLERGQFWGSFPGEAVNP